MKLPRIGASMRTRGGERRPVVRGARCHQRQCGPVALEVAPPVISKVRHGTEPIGSPLLVRMHEVSDFSIREFRMLMVRTDTEAAVVAP